MNRKLNQTEQQFLETYNAANFHRPHFTVDVVIFTVLDHQLHVLLIKRNNHPHKGQWSLVGGYMDAQCDNTIIDIAKRKLISKTGVATPYLEQFETIGNATRDPRGWSVTTVYFALIPTNDIQLKAGVGATEVKWEKITKENNVNDLLAFDHSYILQRCLERLRTKVLYTSLPAFLAPENFTLSELRKYYEIVLGAKLDNKSFRRRMLSVDLLEETDGINYDEKKPAKLYRLKNKFYTHFFMRNIEGVATSFQHSCV